MHSGQALVLFDVFGFILSNLLVNSRYALGRALVRARSYSQITGPPQKLRIIIWLILTKQRIQRLLGNSEEIRLYPKKSQKVIEKKKKNSRLSTNFNSIALNLIKSKHNVKKCIFLSYSIYDLSNSSIE